MTNKINGIDVSEYFVNHYDDSGKLYAVEYKGNPLELQNAVKRLQEKNEGLKSLNDFNVQKIEVLQEENKRLNQELDIKEKMLDKFMIGSGETLEKLQKENEELKKYQYTQEYLQSEIEKRQKALEEIRKEYTNSIFYQCDRAEEECPCHNCIILGQLDRVQNIVKIIDEVLNDRN